MLPRGRQVGREGCCRVGTRWEGKALWAAPPSHQLLWCSALLTWLAHLPWSGVCLDAHFIHMTLGEESPG